MTKVILTERTIYNLKPKLKRYMTWDIEVPGLVLAIHPTGMKVFNLYYRMDNKNRWYKIGTWPQLRLNKTRETVRNLKEDIKEGIDPHSLRKIKKEDINKLCIFKLGLEVNQFNFNFTSLTKDKEIINENSISLKDLEGVYFLLDKEKVVYIGQTGNILLRISQHDKKRDKVFTHFSFFPTSGMSDDVRLTLENRLMFHFQPKYNMRTLKSKPV